MIRFVIGSVVVVTACTAFAANLGFLRDAPITRLSEEELATYKDLMPKVDKPKMS